MILWEMKELVKQYLALSDDIEVDVQYSHNGGVEVRSHVTFISVAPVPGNATEPLLAKAVDESLRYLFSHIDNWLAKETHMNVVPRIEHDKRVTELLSDNNKLLEHLRAAKQEVADLESEVKLLKDIIRSERG